MMNDELISYFKQIKTPKPDSHKGQNGKVMIIGGSELFHAASRWSLDVVSKCVDMVFYASVPSNNELIQEAKSAFWNGIVISREEIDSYIEEADCILIGPGMTRSAETEHITNHLLETFPTKKWVIDAGALQMVNLDLLTERCILTPHQGEFRRLLGVEQLAEEDIPGRAQYFSHHHHSVCLLVKGRVDLVVKDQTVVMVEGGNGGMTKGGTGDVLAGLVAGLYAVNDDLPSTVVASYVNKMAGDKLYGQVGPFFNSSDLVEMVPPVLWTEVKSAQQL